MNHGSIRQPGIDFGQASRRPEGLHDRLTAEQLFDIVPEQDDDPTIHQDATEDNPTAYTARGRMESRMDSTCSSGSNISAEELQQSLLLMYRKQQLTDITIKVGRVKFRCHRVVLSAVSQFFKRILTQEPERRLVIVQNADPGVFEDVLEFIYTGRFVVRDNIGDFLKLVVRIEMMWLGSKFEDILESNMAPDTCIQIWRQSARMPDLQELKQKAGQYVLVNFFDPDITGQLAELTLPELLLILEDNNLQAENEEMVVQRGLDWLKLRKVRAAEAGKLFEHLRLPLTSKEFIYREMATLDAIKDDDTCREVLAEAIAFLSNPERRHEFHSPRITFRKSLPDTEVLVVFGGYKLGGAKVTEVVALDLMDKRWYTLAPLPQHPGKGMAFAVFNNDIYVTGGTRHPMAFWKYICTEDRWEPGPPMVNGRRDHCMVILPGSKVYVVGGMGESDVTQDEGGDNYEDELVLTMEVLDENFDGQWSGVCDLLLPVSQAACCASTDGRKIFVYGGKMADGNATNSLQCVDLKTGTCTLLSSRLPEACAGAEGLRAYSTFYLLTVKGDLMKFDINSAKLLSNQRVPHFNRKRFRVACHHDNLVVVGGEETQQIYRDIVCIRLDESAKELIPCEDFLPPSRSHFGLAKLILAKDFLREAMW